MHVFTWKRGQKHQSFGCMRQFPEAQRRLTHGRLKRLCWQQMIQCRPQKGRVQNECKCQVRCQAILWHSWHIVRLMESIFQSRFDHIPSHQALHTDQCTVDEHAWFHCSAQVAAIPEIRRRQCVKCTNQSAPCAMRVLHVPYRFELGQCHIRIFPANNSRSISQANNAVHSNSAFLTVETLGIVCICQIRHSIRHRCVDDSHPTASTWP